MKIHICNDNKVFPFLYVDDWYTPEEEKLIWKELDFYTNPITMHRAEDDKKGSGAATDKDGTSKNKAWRLYLDATYSRREVSHILRLQPLKMSSDEIQDAIKETGPNFRMYGITNFVKMMTTICWFYHTPKSYTGGDVTFTDIDTILECNHNRMVMFPSYYFHMVHPIKMKDKNSEMGQGRYAIQDFYCQKTID